MEKGNGNGNGNENEKSHENDVAAKRSRAREMSFSVAACIPTVIAIWNLRANTKMVVLFRPRVRQKWEAIISELCATRLIKQEAGRCNALSGDMQCITLLLTEIKKGFRFESQIL